MNKEEILEGLSNVLETLGYMSNDLEELLHKVDDEETKYCISSADAALSEATIGLKKAIQMVQSIPK